MRVPVKRDLNSQPKLANARTIYLLVREDNQELSCLSSLRFDPSIALKEGNRVVVTGEFQGPDFCLDDAAKEAA